VRDQPSLRILLAVGLVAGCTLALQVLLTRFLSAVLFYHFAFLAISLALLGVGAGAIALYVRPAWFDRRPLAEELRIWAIGLAVVLVSAPLILVRLDYSFDDEITLGFSLNLAAACLLAFLPFAAAGVFIALAVRAYALSLGRLYAFDLVGAGLGAVAVVPLLWLIDAPTLIVGLGAFGALAALLVGGRETRRLSAAVLAIAAVATVLAQTTDLYELPPETTAPAELEPVADVWTPLSRVVGYPPQGDSRFATVFYDQIYAPVPVYQRGDPPLDWRDLRLGPQTIGYALTGPGDALVIGGGGGRDIHNALSSGQRRVDVIELNREIRDVVDDDLGEWSGSPYTLPRVHTTIGDGRSTLAARDRDYDQIHIGFTDTLSANSAQGFALTENNLYTVEAFQEYLRHLRPGGVLNVSRLYRLVGDEALRITILALETLEREGVADPERNVVVILGKDIFGELYGTVLARLEPYTETELAQIRRLAEQRGEGVAFAPGGPYQLEWADLAAAPSPEKFCEGYRLDVCPPTDDRPFFFHMKRTGDALEAPAPGYIYTVDPFRVLLLALGILLVLSAVAVALPLFMIRGQTRPPLSALAFFAAIGLGFLFVEIVLIQRFVLFLGFPTYALSIVLFSLLIFTGIGALLSERVREPRRALVTALLVATAMLVAAAWGLQPLLRELIEAPFAVRVVLTVLLLAPLGVLLGTAMPLGLRRLATLYSGAAPWGWGINGVASVLASVAAVATALVSGFTVATIFGAVCYLGAAAHAAYGRWP
jgi:hypothetical protein